MNFQKTIMDLHRLRFCHSTALNNYTKVNNNLAVEFGLRKGPLLPVMYPRTSLRPNYTL